MKMDGRRDGLHHQPPLSLRAGCSWTEFPSPSPFSPGTVRTARANFNVPVGNREQGEQGAFPFAPALLFPSFLKDGGRFLTVREPKAGPELG